MNPRELLKRAARDIAWILVTPSVIAYRIRSRVIGADRALETATEAWAGVPGLRGQYLRRAFLTRTLAACADSATVGFGVLFSSPSATIGEHAYIGPRCHIGWAHIGRGALLAAGVHVPSGPLTHGTAEVDIPVRDQPGQKRAVHIGAGTWIGSGAVVMADVGADTVVGAGAVVVRSLPDRVVAAGVPARIVRSRAAAFDRSAV